MKDSEPRTTREEFLRNLPKNLWNSIHRILDNHSNDEKEKNLIAHLNVSNCLAWNGTTCQICYLACPKRDKAIEIWFERPVIVASNCNGCAVCQVACETVNSLPTLRMVSFTSSDLSH